MKNVKRILTILLIMALLSGTALAATYVTQDVWYPVLVNGTAMTFTEAGGLPMVYEGRTLLPLKAVSEALGIDIQWVNNRVEITTVDTEKLKDACVMVYVGSNGIYTNQGSGVLIDYDEILTCYHVVDEGKTMFSAVYDNGAEKKPCSLTDTAENKDAAILTPADKTVKPVPIGDSDTVKVGDTVYVVSSPNEQKNVVTTGTVIKVNSYVNGMLGFELEPMPLTSAGSSGGGIFDVHGNLIGMIQSGDNISVFVIPINAVRAALAA